MHDPQQLLTDDEVSRFITDGFLVLQTDLPSDFHAGVTARLREVTEQESWHGNNVVARIPALYDVVRCSRVQGALTSLLGGDFLFHPHRAVHRSTPIDDPTIELDSAVEAPPMGRGSTAGSGWHQDAQSPLARARHHVPRFLIGFYFPHDTPWEMGPTRLQAGSYLWPHPPHKPSGVVVPELVRAGTFMLVHFDMVHAGFSNRTETTRYMLKFVFSRMSPPKSPAWDSKRSEWRHGASQSEVKPVRAWSYIWQWLRGENPVASGDGELADFESDDFEVLTNTTYQSHPPGALAAQLRTEAGRDLHARVLTPPHRGKQYVRDDIRGYPRRWNERAIVMAPSTYALVAQGEAAIESLLELSALEDPWVDVNVAFALGEIGQLCSSVRAQLALYLRSEHQQVVRQAVDAIGFCGENADDFLDDFVLLMSVERDAWQQKEVERGWCAQDQIRLNIMFACVALLNTSTDRDRLQALFDIGLGDQGYSAQVGVEGLSRIGTESALSAALRYTSERSWDDTLLAMAKAY